MAFKTIELRDVNKNVVEEALVSVEDYERVNKYKWNMNIKKFKYGEPLAYVHGYVDGKPMTMHKFIMGTPNKGFVIDHINNNGLDNQRCNLRFASYSENSQNRRKIIKENTTSIYIGVSKVDGKFEVQQGGKRLGTFKDEIEAAKHYDKYVAIKFNGGGKKNFEVSDEDIKDITLNDLILTKPNLRDLPKNIHFSKLRKTYYARIEYQGKEYISKQVKTLNEALVDLTVFQTIIKQRKDNFIKEHYEIPINRNKNNEAVIIITKNENVCECIVDDEFWHELRLSKWWMTTDGYALTDINGVPTTMHSYLLNKKQTNTDVIDHINRNRLDNRMSNLRSVSVGVNNQNRTKKEGCSSEYIGVSKLGEKWRARISINGKRKSLGLHESEIDAAKAYNNEAREVYGDNAHLNQF